jgi:tRNA pseudouridine13 synthase
MKVKFRAEDFFVEEVLKDGVVETKKVSLERKPNMFAVYRVKKRNVDTLTVIHEMSKILKIPRDMFFSCGLKDKYSESIQFIAVSERGFKNKIVERVRTENFEADFVGESREPLSSKHIMRNFFRIVLRDIDDSELKEYEEGIKQVAISGFPNYFDEQRFGSARHFADERSEEFLDFIGKRVLRGDFEGALKIHFQAVSEHDRSRVKKFKKVMREKWGNWAECLLEAQDKNDIKILRYLLRKPNDFKGAFAMIDPRLGRLYLEVYQNYIFNRVLAEFIKKRFSRYYLFPYVAGFFVFPYKPAYSEVSVIKDLKIPLPHPDAEIPPEIEEIYYEVLKDEGVSLSDFRSSINSIDFVNSVRSAWEIPEKLEWKISNDEFHERRKKIELSFYLKKGVFATMIIKSITPLLPVSDTEKKPIPVIYTKDGKEIKVERTQDQFERKKVIILSRSSS